MGEDAKSVTKVDLSAVYDLNFEKLLNRKMTPERLAKQLAATDLAVNPADGSVHLETPDGAPVDLYKEVSQFYLWLQAAGEDKVLSLDEVKRGLPARYQNQISPEAYLNRVQQAVDNRLQPLRQNMKRWQAGNLFEKQLERLADYNKDMYAEEVRYAHGTWRSFSKGLLNVVMTVIPVSPANWVLEKVGLFDKGTLPVLDSDTENTEPGFFLADRWAHESAYSGFYRRKGAIDELKFKVEAGIRKGEDWALNLDFDQALAKLSEDDQEILRDELDGKPKWDQAKIKDDTERNRAELEYAKGERKAFLDWGGGNASSDQAFNFTGGISVFNYAKSDLNYLAKKSDDDQIKAEANQLLSEMGDGSDGGGKLSNWFAVGLTNVFSLGGWFFEPTKYRNWSDENMTQLPGRAIHYGLVMSTMKRPIRGVRTGLSTRGKEVIDNIAQSENRLAKATTATGRGIAWVGGGIKKYTWDKAWGVLPKGVQNAPANVNEAIAKNFPKAHAWASEGHAMDWLLAYGLAYGFDPGVEPEPYAHDVTRNRTPWPDPMEPDVELRKKKGLEIPGEAKAEKKD